MYRKHYSSCRLGNLNFKKMPFGLSGAPMTFQMLMNRLFAHLDFVKVYLDDILVHSANLELHHDHLRQVFEILAKEGLTINLEKSHFFKNQVNYIGFNIDKGIITPSVRNLEKIANIQIPTNKKAVKRIIGALNYFRDMIPNLSARLAPISDLTSDKVQFNWKPEYTDIVTKIIKELQEKAYQIQPNFKLLFTIFCDASKEGIGAILTQNNQLIACFSRKLQGAEQNYTTSEQEALAIVCALKYWRYWLLGKEIEVYTDHSNLKFLNSSNSLRCNRWKLLIDEFKPKITHLSGQKNYWADMLSREQSKKEINYSQLIYPMSKEEIKNEQRKDEESIRIKEEISTNESDPRFTHLTILDDYLVSKSNKTLFVPKAARLPILKWVHDSLKHPGITSMYGTIAELFYWLN